MPPDGSLPLPPPAPDRAAVAQLVRGSKGGKGGGGRTPTEAPDSLRSKAYARVVDLVSEGEIQGFVNGFKSILFDGVPVENQNGTRNFADFRIDWRFGTQGQTAMEAFSAQESEQVVAVEVTAAVSITRTVSNVNVDTVRVNLRFPALSSTDVGSGDVSGTSVEFAIDVQSAGGGFVEKYRQTVSGKTVNGYQKSVRVPLTGAAPWDVRVRRITADSTSQFLLNKLFWDSYTEIISTRLRHPNSAVVGIAIDAQQFSRIPVRGYDLLGLRIKVPTNYNSITRVYTGVWDGTFQIAWTNNPAWIFYDLLATKRYGLGRFVAEADVDKFALYTIGQYCDQLVPDGLGGMEPRFTCNVYIQTKAEAYQLLHNLASVFRGIVFWGGAGVGFAQDAPSDAAALYSNANVIDGTFEYQDSSAKARHTAVLVQWNDPADQFRAAQVWVDDEPGIQRYGIVDESIVAFGCTSKGQAVRAGKWLLHSEINETEVVAFRVGSEGVLTAPGRVIRIADVRKANERIGGRIRSATTLAVTLDTAVTLNAGETYTLLVVDPDATPAVLSRTVANGAGTWQKLNMATALPVAPTAQSVWLLASNAVQPTTWRVLGVGEVEGSNEFQITAVAHNPSKYGAIEQGLQLENYPVSRLTTHAKPVTGLLLSESLFLDRGVAKAKLTVAFTPGAPNQRFVISWRRALATWQTLPQTTQQTIDILNIDPGAYEVQVVALNSLGNASSPVSGTFTALGKTAPPANVTGFFAVLEEFGIRLHWTAVPDLDVFEYELRLGGTSWETAPPLAGSAPTRVGATSYFWRIRSGGTYKVWIKAVDDGERFSAIAASVDVVVAVPAVPAAAGLLVGPNYVLTWSAVTGSFAVDRYRVRKGAVFATAPIVAEPLSTRFEAKADWVNSQRFWVSALDVAGNESAGFAVDIVVTAPAAPGSFLADVIVNHLQFRWTRPAASLPIASYRMRKGATWAGAASIGDKSGDQTFTTHQESAGGTYLYWIAAVDSAGNEGTPVSISIKVDPPSNFRLQIDWHDDFSGTKTQCILDAAKLKAPLLTSETFATHFTSRSWNTPQDQINAGFPLYFMPGATSGSYERVFDYGTTIAVTTLIQLVLTTFAASGSVTITPTLSVSNTSATGPWTDFAGVFSALASNFRWVKVLLNFAATGGDDLVEISDLNLRLALKTDTEAGRRNAADFVSGVCSVTFAKPWIDVDAINVTPQTTSRREWAVEFTDAPNPTQFKVRMWDPVTGNLVATDFSYSVDGVL